MHMCKKDKSLFLNILHGIGIRVNVPYHRLRWVQRRAIIEFYFED
jgi:hypothetical protein